jgi:hypothetical protein
LNAVDAKLAEIDARLRYFALEGVVRPPLMGDADERREALDRLDAEISRCRQMLSDLESHAIGVRRELVEVHPDGTADTIGSLAEQRATVGVLEHLLDDLDAEVALLARSHEPSRSIGGDAHGRLAPMAQMLRQQLYALCGQVTEQERVARRVRIKAELRQLGRAQSDLSEQLEHLLERRQLLVFQSQLAGRAAASPPQPPVAGHCQCQRHDEFIRFADEALLGRFDRPRLEDDARVQRQTLEGQRNELRAACDSVGREINELAARWDRLQHERAGAAETATLNELRAELERLENEISRSLHAPLGPAPRAAIGALYRRVWKASDALAQLTGGQLTQIRLSREGRAPAIIDRDGRTITIDQLTAGQQDQLYLALVLALVSSMNQRGLDLPMILDEPFLRQDAANAAAMAGVLAEFAREGRQVLVLTEDHEAVRRFQTLSVEIHDIDALRRGDQLAPAPAAPPPSSAAAPVTPTEAPAVRIVRETVMSGSPTLRAAGQRLPAAADKTLYYLTADASLADFPVLGNDTVLAFSSLGVRTVGDLLAADAADVARRLAHPAVTAQAVRLWQYHISLMCYVPGVSLVDAQVLAACEVNSPEALFAIDVKLLAEAVARFLATERGRRFASSRTRLTLERLALWQKQARRQRDRWQLESARYGWVDALSSAPAESAPIRQSRTTRRRTAGASPTPPRLVRPSKPRPLRFFLNRTSPVERAPSIGRTMAQRLAQVGIRTVADLLNASPESTAEELGVRRATATAIARWQSEARLACRIPEMRGMGAQLLVACGLTEPEQIARTSLAELAGKVYAVCHTAEGRRLLHDGQPPSKQRIAAWIRHAAHTRPLEAA